MQNWLKKWFGQSAGDKQQRSAFIIADPTGQATSHSMNECRAIALCLRRKGYEAKVIGATAHPLRPDGILVPLDQCLEKWRTQKTLQRFVLFISARKLKGGIAVRPELRIFSRKQDSCCRGEDHFYSAYLTDLLRNLYDTSGLLDVFGDGSHFQFLDSCKAFIPLSALFRLLNCYPGKKAVVVKADHASGFVSALLQIQPRETIVMSVSKETQPADCQKLLACLAEFTYDESLLKFWNQSGQFPKNKQSRILAMWGVTKEGTLISFDSHETREMEYLGQEDDGN